VLTSRAGTYFKLGRVSNLPTVWTNAVAGATLASGATAGPIDLVWLALAMSLAYTGGMFLNDAFDRDIDAKERPERPIPKGEVSAQEVFTLGYAMLGLAVAIVYWRGGFLAAAACAALAGAIVLYDAWHKTNPLSPFVMALCRALVYVTCALAAGSLSWALLGGAGALFAYVVGLTFFAKYEGKGEARKIWPLVLLAIPFAQHLGDLSRGLVAPALFLGFLGLVGWAVSRVWTSAEKRASVPHAIVALIAGISLLDGLALASAGHEVVALAAASGFFATRAAQKWVRGT
jgi:4-hydroxybenzoate polyprenyltransferase